MPKILFIQPIQYGNDGKLIKQKRIYLPGLVFPLLAAMTPKHWQVEVKLEVVETIDFDTDADIVGIGSMGYAMLHGMEIGDEFRRRGKTVVMGGYMASMMVEEALKHVDSVVVGDAEISYPMMLADFEREGTLQRIYHYPVTSLDGLPIPDYRVLLDKKIGDMLPAQAGRGCPNTCSFCSIACIYKGQYLFRPIDEVIRDIRAIKDLGFKKFYLIDDNIVSNRDYLISLCKALIPLKMEWATQCALKIGDDPELLALIHRSGASTISFGVESVTQEGLNKLNKAWLRVEDHKRRIKNITDAGILVSSEMIVGTDSDTEESIRATADFVLETRIPMPRFYILTPTPGTPLHEEMKAQNRILTYDWQKYDGSSCVHRPAKMTPERLDEMFWWLYEKVFTWRSILARTLLHPKFLKAPGTFLLAFLVNLHYRNFVKKRIPPNIL